jgi:two-component system, NtrC family, nitrogen regulation response regulator NtrX
MVIDEPRVPGVACGAAMRAVQVSVEEEPGYILVIDDDEDICEVISMILADEGYEVTTARDGARALAMIQRRPPALILLDLSITGNSAQDLVTAYRQTIGEAGSIIVVSGHVNVEQRAESVGADAFLSKPFDVPILIDTVQAILSVRANVQP